MIWHNLARVPSVKALYGSDRRGVHAHHCPVDVVSYSFEERGAVPVLKFFEDLANTVRSNCHLNHSLSLAICLSAFAIRYAGIMPITKVLKRNPVITEFMPHVQQNDERSAGRAGVNDS
jgi:hypothetical protein